MGSAMALPEPIMTPTESAKLAHDRRTYNLSRASLIVSILALIASITSPIATYYWFQGELRIREIKIRSFAAEGLIEEWYDTCRDESSKTAIYSVHLGNSGDLPIDKVRITLRQPSEHELNASYITDTPPIGFKVTDHQRGRLTLNFEEPLPPHTSLTVWLGKRDHIGLGRDSEQFAPSAWMTSEVSGAYIKWNMDDGEHERVTECGEGVR